MCWWNVLKTIFSFFMIFIFWDMVDFVLKILRKLTNCHHKWPNYWGLLWFCLQIDQNAFQKILRKWKMFRWKKKNSKNYYFLLKIIWNVCKISFIKIGAKKSYVNGLHFLKPPGSWEASPPTTTIGDFDPIPRMVWMNPSSQLVSLVNVSELGSQRIEDAAIKVPNSLRILSIILTKN